MENNERDRKLDQWLDEALSNYSAAEPRFGLEQRVLNRIRGEEQRSRKWNFWRWMPAFGAIAAVVVVAVAVRPMLEKKKDAQPARSGIDTYSRSTEETQKSASTEPGSTSVASPTTKSASKPDVNNGLGGAPLRRELRLVPQKKDVPMSADRDDSVSSQSARVDNQLRGDRSAEKDNRSSVNGPVALASAAAAGPPPPPPPPSPMQVQPLAVAGVAGGVVGGAPPVAAKAAPAGTNQPALNANAAMVEANQLALLNDKVATQSMTSVIAKDSRRKEAHTKPEARAQDANTMEAFGVTARFQTGPTIPTQQFPTPVPLSNQEKLALKAGAALKDSTAAQDKSADLTPIEIKDVEIKPLEGPEKEK